MTQKHREPIEAVIFDLDGVLVSTDEYHYRSWQRLADEEGIPFDREFNERFRGVSRMECLEMLLEQTSRSFTEQEKFELADRKNGYYREMISDLGPKDLLPNAARTLEALRERDINIAIASGSKNAPFILERLQLREGIDAAVSGLDITRSKPDPQVFLMAAEQIGAEPARCLVVEDAESGVEAARRAGMRALGIGDSHIEGARRTVRGLNEITVEEMLSL